VSQVGLSKEEAEVTMGREPVMAWRRSWAERPPPMTRHPYFQSMGSHSTPQFDWQTDIWTKVNACVSVCCFLPSLPGPRSSPLSTFTCGPTQPINIEIQPGKPPVKSIEKNAVIPLAESLKDCSERVQPLWEQKIVPRIIAGETVLIVAHSNTIRYAYLPEPFLFMKLCLSFRRS
jgi:bisphosphoglycerate-dependent phosphoglycerate mutase